VPRLHVRTRATRLLGSVFTLILLAAPAAQALRIVQYNLTNYPNQSSVRNPYYRTILQNLGADVVVSQEMTGTGANPPGLSDFLNNVLNTLEPGQWSVAPFSNGNDTDNALFYKPSKVQILGSWAFYPNPATNLRLVTVWRVKPVGYSASSAEFRIYSCHLKASQGFEAARLSEAIGIRDSMNAMPPGTHALLCGDFNIYTSTEGAYGRFIESEADNDGRVYDTQSAGVWHNTGSFAPIHTQCPCLNNCPAGFGFSGGGMDDRFDMLLPTYPFANGTGLQILPSTYHAIGNDGLHFNLDINSAPTIPEGQTFANALVNASDHLPVRVDIQLPSQITVTPGLIAFGNVLIGATASQNVSVANPAVSPADNLDYSFVVGSGFFAPAGNFSLAPGAPAVLHAVSMSTIAAGVKTATLVVSSDAVDAPVTNLALSGTVLRHSVPSFDGTTTVQAAGLDFGSHAAGQFADQSVSVYNRDFDALQSQLVLGSAAITGGSGRFSIAGGFNPLQVAGTPPAFAIHFDDSGLGAAGDSAFAATLTFTTADQALPGGQAQPNLVVALTANSLATDAQSALPVTTRLYAPMPNPPGSGGTTLRFDLAQSGGVRLEVFDVAGRRVTSLASAPYFAGVHAVRWTGRSDAGQTLGSGVYFVRMTGHFATQTVRVTLVR
jgi:endonuclease/exonuclease/phosphatase family metal-dependent hydrolase